MFVAEHRATAPRLCSRARGACKLCAGGVAAVRQRPAGSGCASLAAVQRALPSALAFSWQAQELLSAAAEDGRGPRCALSSNGLRNF